MKRAVFFVLMIGVLLALAAPVQAQSNCAFTLGFKTLHDMIPNNVGDCVESEGHNPQNGDGLQRTKGGLLVWRKADNWTAFTDGYRTWINGPSGLQQRLNTERFPWETDAASAPAPAAAPAAPAGPTYNYVDPRSLKADTASYVGQKVFIQGQALGVSHYNSPSFSWVQVLAIVRDRGITQSVVVRFYPKEPGILSRECYRMYGTVTGTETMTLVQTGADVDVPVIRADKWEPAATGSYGGCVAP